MASIGCRQRWAFFHKLVKRSALKRNVSLKLVKRSSLKRKMSLILKEAQRTKAQCVFEISEAQRTKAQRNLRNVFLNQGFF